MSKKKAMFFKQSGGGSSYLLDTYSAESAYSFRKVKSDALYSCEIRRVSDNALASVELEDTGQISLSSTINLGGTLGAWIGSDDGLLNKWYDQSGNSRDFTHSSNLWWSIITAGVLNTNTDSHISAYLQGGLREYITSGTALNINGEFLEIMILDTDESIAATNTVNRFNENNYFGVLAPDVGVSADSGVTTSSYYANGTILTPNDRNQLKIGWSDPVGAILATCKIEYPYTVDTLTIGYNFSVGSFSYIGYMTEVILFDVSETANQSDIESAINDEYEIYI